MLGHPSWEEREEAREAVSAHGKDADLVLKQLRVRAVQSGDDRYAQHLSRVIRAIEKLAR